MTSLWAISGNHYKIKFDEWINMDIEYSNDISLLSDLKIIAMTGFNLIKSLKEKVFKKD